MAARPGARPILGWREYLALPGLRVDAIKVKVDTGARTSALHAFDLDERTEGGLATVRFRLCPRQRDDAWTVDAEAPLVDRRRVRDTSGRVELRPVVSLEVELMGRRWPIEVTLTRRDPMGFRMLLGRQAIRGRFTVDPARSFAAGRP